MPIPDWNDYGILPAGVHSCQIGEIERRLAFNNRRAILLRGLEHVLGWLGEMPRIESLILDGSFVTNKEHPGDIDAVAMIGNLPDPQQHEWVRAWQPMHSELKTQYHVDLYPTVRGGNNFSAFFQYLKPEEALERGAPLGTLKGLLRIEP